ncbi:MAG: flagellar hook capping protein [Nevskia sp.]|nr:flagellar hook capping protein [Nevskia sp.]
MPVDAIGSTVGSGAGQIQRTGLSTDDFIKLFLTQLTFQDPLNPVDNAQFLAQLAQFTSIQQTQILSDNVVGLLTETSVSQSVSLIGKTVQVDQGTGTPVVGSVTTVQFQSGAPSLTIKQSDGTIIQNVALSQITLVR